MAEIKTEKQVVLVNDPNPSFVNFAVTNGNVVLTVKNEQTTHHVHLAPPEAIQMGVALIQLAAAAGGQRAHEEAKRRATKLVPGV